jgi:hypothetical protein
MGVARPKPSFSFLFFSFFFSHFGPWEWATPRPNGGGRPLGSKRIEIFIFICDKNENLMFKTKVYKPQGIIRYLTQNFIKSLYIPELLEMVGPATEQLLAREVRGA